MFRVPPVHAALSSALLIPLADRLVPPSSSPAASSSRKRGTACQDDSFRRQGFFWQSDSAAASRTAAKSASDFAGRIFARAAAASDRGFSALFASQARHPDCNGSNNGNSSKSSNSNSSSANSCDPSKVRQERQHANDTGDWQLPSESLQRRAHALRSSFQSDDGWITSWSFAGISCSYQPAQGGRGLVRVRVEAEVDAPIFDLAALFYEVDKWHLWAPNFGNLGLRKAAIVGMRDPVNVVIRVMAALPFPFDQRNCCFAAQAVDGLLPGSPHRDVAILLDSEKATEICPTHGAQQDASLGTRAELFESGFLLTPGEACGRAGTLVQAVINIDPNMNVPEWMVTVGAMNFCVLVILQWRRAHELARSEEYLQVSCDPGHPFYMHLRHRLKETTPGEYSKVPPLRSASSSKETLSSLSSCSSSSSPCAHDAPGEQPLLDFHLCGRANAQPRGGACSLKAACSFVPEEVALGSRRCSSFVEWSVL